MIREYETKLLELEDENSSRELKQSTETSESLRRIAHILRQLLRVQEGEDVSSPERREIEEEWAPWKSIGQVSADHALEREIELARLEKENEELRRMMGLLPAQLRPESQRMVSGVQKRVHSPG